MISLLLALSTGVNVAAAAAPALPDPTRPPPGVVPSAPGARAEEETAAAASQGLQVVIIAPGRRVAVIDGRSVELGEKYDGYTLVEVTEGAVVLRDAGGRRRVLSMFPESAIKRSESLPVPQPHTQGNGKTGVPEAGKGVSHTPPQGAK